MPFNIFSSPTKKVHKKAHETHAQPPIYYRVAIALLKPLYALFLRRRAAKGVQKRADISLENELAMRFAKRFCDVRHANKRYIWVHAVSLGETNTIAPIVEMLLADGYAVVMTSTTQTGFARVQTLFSGRVDHSFMIVDTAQKVQAFIAHYQPCCALFVETELWANTLYELAKAGIASVLVNARLSQASYLRYARFKRLSQTMMVNITAIICQDTDSKTYFAKLGAPQSKLKQAPSLKFAAHVPGSVKAQAKQIKQQWHIKRPILLAASTHEGEEAMVLDAFAKLPTHHDALLIVVPRHPERFDTVARTISDRFSCARRSQNQPVLDSTQVYLADTMGELLIFYALSDMALVGGSLTNIGGHNPVEACLLDTPVVMGRFTQKCQVVVDALKAEGGISIVANLDELSLCWKSWLNQPLLAQTQAAHAKRLCMHMQHAHEAQYQKIKPYLPLANTNLKPQ